MSLKISEVENKKIAVHNTVCALDQLLTKDDISPLPACSGYSILIIGPSGSGKTTLLNSIMTKPKRKGHRQSYKGLFDLIYVISPTLGGTSVKGDKFATLPTDQIYRELNMNVLDELEEKLYQNKKDGLHSCVVMDDIGSQLKGRGQKCEKKIVQMLQNRRHVSCSYITLLQKFKDCPNGIRSNTSHLAFFRPKNRIEKEAIMHELMPYDNKKNEQIFSYVFDNEKNKFPFMFIDMSLKKSNKYQFYSGFNHLAIDEEPSV